MPTFNPWKEIEKFYTKTPDQFRVALEKYSKQDLEVMCAILLITVFTARDKLKWLKGHIY